MVEAVFWDAPVMVAVANCESGFTHYLPSGDIIWSHTNDGGVMQINLAAHQRRMESLGLDITDINDNLNFARMLYDEQGKHPWVCSRLVAQR